MRKRLTLSGILKAAMSKYLSIRPDDRRLRAVQALALAPTISQAAREARVSRTSIYAWLREPEFFDQVRTARRRARRSGAFLRGAGRRP